MEREALKLAVDGLEKILHTFAKDGKVVMSSMIRNELFAEVNSLLQQAKASLAQPAQGPVAFITNGGTGELWWSRSVDEDGNPNTKDIPLYTTPPKRPWVGLIEEDFVLINQLCINPIESAEFAARLLKKRNT